MSLISSRTNTHKESPSLLGLPSPGIWPGFLLDSCTLTGLWRKSWKHVQVQNKNTFGMTTTWKLILILMGTEATPTYPVVQLRNSLMVSFQAKRWNSPCSFSHCSKEAADPNFKPEALLVNSSQYICIPSAFMQLTENHDFRENAEN